MTDERIRAQEGKFKDYLREHRAENTWFQIADLSSMWVHVGAAFALSERDAATEQCCKDVCEACRNGLSVVLNEYGVWFHPEASSSPFKCKADGIRTRVAAQGEK